MRRFYPPRLCPSRLCPPRFRPSRFPVQRVLACSLGRGLVLCVWLWVCGVSAWAKPKPGGAQQTIEHAVAAYQNGDYEKTRAVLEPLFNQGLLHKNRSTYRSRDYLLWLLGESEALLAQQMQKPALCASAVTRFLAIGQVEDTPLSTHAQARLGDCFRMLGKMQQAQAAYRRVLASRAVDAGCVRFRLAEIVSTENAQEARTLLRQVYVEHPVHPLAESAIVKLRQLDREAKLEAREQLERAKNLLLARRWFEAVDELRAMPPDLVPQLRTQVDYTLGMALYKTRRNYLSASNLLLEVAKRLSGEQKADALFHGARALSRIDRDDEAIAGYHELLSAHPRSKYSAEASFLIGWLEYNRKQYDQAIVRLEQTLKQFTAGSFPDEARWYIAWSRYLLGNYPAALSSFGNLTQKAGWAGQKATYWSGVCLGKMGKTSEANALFRKLAEHDPFSYYGMLGRVRLQNAGQAVALFVDPTRKEASNLPGFEWPPSKLVLADERLRRVNELLRFSLKSEAAHELSRIEAALLSQFGPPTALPVLFDLYLRADHFRRPHLLAETYGGAALRKDPLAVLQARPFWEAMYPLAYRRFIEKHEKSGDNPRRYLYSIMQKESAYNPYDVSYADAIGLLQMIPPTSRRVAEHIGKDYTDDVLYDPEGNIQFGAWYIGHLLTKFKGQIALGAGSYNAGPRAMTRWIERQGERTLDEFIELCPYSQTREYMKKLLAIYARYVYLWDKEQYLPSLQIDPEFLTDDGIDY